MKAEMLFPWVWGLLFCLTCAPVGGQNAPCNQSEEVCPCNVTLFEAGTDRSDISKPFSLHQAVNFYVAATWSPDAIVGMNVYHRNTLLPHLSVAFTVGSARKCGDRVEQKFALFNEISEDGPITGYDELKVIMFMKTDPNKSVVTFDANDMNVMNDRKSHCILQEVVCFKFLVTYHFAPYRGKLYIKSTPAQPKLNQYLNISCSTKDGNPPPVKYGVIVYSTKDQQKLFHAVVSDGYVEFPSAFPGRYICESISYPRGVRVSVTSRDYIMIMPEEPNWKLGAQMDMYGNNTDMESMYGSNTTHATNDTAKEPVEPAPTTLAPGGPDPNEPPTAGVMITERSNTTTVANTTQPVKNSSNAGEGTKPTILLFGLLLAICLAVS
ncbi:uncharacterized protein LOC131957822 [Physella acuta]|uniref:uncharacterized protein LOC131957822 n=1 Tax=Physella acuta TaxID=109671 RepID=UPI0027DC01A2|nr:uncharacterized protein LOC131957822 [Physella acuta]